VKQKFDLGRRAGSYGVAVAPDGSVYVATTGLGKLFRWTPGADQLEDFGKLIDSESHLYKLTFDSDGVVYGGTYPNGKVFSFDPETREVRDYGQAAEGQSYVRSVGIHGDSLFVGTQPHTHLVEINVDSGEKQEVAFPDGTDLEQVVYDVNIVGDLLFTRLTKTGLYGDLFVRDLRDGSWVSEIPGVSGLDVSQVADDGKVYFSQHGALSGYDVDTGEVSATDLKFEFTAQLRSVGLGDVGDPEFPGQSVIGMLLTGEIVWYNIETGAHRVFEAKLESNPVRMRSLAQGPNGSVLTGGTGTGAFAMADPETGESEAHRFSEVMGMVAVEDEIYLGAYPRARVYDYDPDQPWEWANIGDDQGQVNPSAVYNGDKVYGDRPFTMVDIGDDMLAIGTVNKSGYLGGSLVLHNRATGESVEYPELVPDQSVMSLAYADGVLYVGTSVYGGYGAEETQTEAKMVAWDVAAGEKLWETVPVADERTVSDLTFDPDGRLWGVTAGVVFQVDPETGETTRQERYAEYDWPIDGGYALADLEYNAKDGGLYSSMPNKGLFRLDPESWDDEVITDRPVYRMFVHDNGDVFTNEGAELLRYRPS
ncbi:MAG: hypothetical protein ACRDXX_14200, partial [Stackebrandtia sp.]